MPGFQKFCDLDELADGKFLCNDGVIVIRFGDQFYGYVNECPHMYKDFCSMKSLIIGHQRIRCGAHVYEFDCRTGEQIRSGRQKPTDPMISVKTRLIGSEVWIEKQ